MVVVERRLFFRIQTPSQSLSIQSDLHVLTHVHFQRFVNFSIDARVLAYGTYVSLLPTCMYSTQPERQQGAHVVSTESS